MHRRFLKLAAILAMLAVMLGAFGAHGLKNKVSEQMLSAFQTGVTYQFYHVFALFLTAIIYRDLQHTSLIWAARLFIAGIVLFCGSLYAITFTSIGGTSWKWLGPITPVGGLCFIIGWILMFTAFLKKKPAGSAR